MIDYAKDPSWQAVCERAARGEWSEFDPLTLILEDPAEYERLLHAYSLLRGQTESWFERVAEAASPRWKDCIRSAIVRVAGASGIGPKTLALWLDTAPLPKTRARVLALAREIFAR